MKQVLHLSLALLALLFVGCGYDDSAIIDRIENLEQNLNTKIATINEQIEAINNSIASLEAAKTDLDQRIKDAQADANANAEDIAKLQEAKVTLEERISTLQTYVNTELKNAKEWASATFATLEQYYGLANDIAGLKSVVDGLDEVLKQWVNEQLAGYYPIAEVNAALKALQDSVDEDNKALQEDIKELFDKIDAMNTELTEAYTTAIEEAINTNNGVIDGKIAEEIAAVNGRIDSEVEIINARIDALEERIEDLEEALDKIKALDIVLDIESGKACMAGASIEFGYTIVGGDDATEVESFGDGGWRADVTATDATSGRIRVTAPKDGGNGKVIVLATSGAGASAMKSIRFEEGILTDIADRYEVDWEACTLAVRLKTNVDYEVRIPAEAQSWLSVADTRATVRQETLTFSISENPEDSPARTAVIELVSEFGEVLQCFEIAQKMQPLSDPIQFADKFVKKVCVEKFDTNGDGELSYKEAAAVTDLGSYLFGDYALAVKSFDELQYFVNIVSIGSYAFSGCSKLTNITVPEGVMSIRNYAFYNCPSLKRVNISNLSVWYKISFDNCGNPLCNGANLYVNDELVIDIVIPSDITSINPYLFSGCTSIRSVVIPEGVTSIGNAAFSGCSSLSSITIPESATAIGDFAFYGCSSLSSITIPEGVTSIGGRAFSDCSSLTSITIPEGVVSIGDSTFSNCSSLTSITIPESVVSIGEYAFCGCSSLTSITIPEGVISIGEYAFYGCSSLTSITIPEDVISIRYDAFYNCPNLKKVNISNLSAWCKISFYDDDNHYGCSNPLCNGADLYINNELATDVVIPSDIVSLNNILFHGCISIRSVVIPESVVSIGEYAFCGCSSLTSITIPESVTSIGRSAFSGCSSLTSMTIPEGVVSIGEYTFSGCSSLASITIPEGVTAIGQWAFRGCSSLTGITIPESVVSIGRNAFENCTNLTSITIPEDVNSIGYEAFYICRSLESVYCKSTIPPGAKRYMGHWIAFYGNASGRKIYVPMESVEAYKSADGWKDYADSIVGYDFSE